MLFEWKLAKRYMFAQKKHTIITMFCIVLALTLLTTIFVGVSSFLGIARDIVHAQAEYHAFVDGLTKDEAEGLSQLVGVEKVTIEEYYPATYEGTISTVPIYSAKILFQNGIPDLYSILPNYINSLHNEDAVYIYDSTLMILDGVGDEAKYTQATILAFSYVFVCLLIFGMRFIIDTAFELSASERKKQFGILQSIGATNKQIVGIITSEGIILCLIGIPFGVGLGILISYLLTIMISHDTFVRTYLEVYDLHSVIHLHINPLYLVIAIVTGLVWTMLSAYSTGLRILGKTPVDNLSGEQTSLYTAPVKRYNLKPHGWLYRVSFRNLKRRPRRSIATIISLMIALTLIPTVTLLLPRFERAITEQSTSVYTDRSFSIQAFYDPTNLETYKKEYEQLENESFLKAVNATLICFAQDHSKPESPLLTIFFVNRKAYEEAFLQAPPVSYDELTANNGFLLFSNDYSSDCTALSLELQSNSRLLSNDDFEEFLLSASFSDAESAKEYNRILEETLYTEKHAQYPYVPLDYHFPSEYKIVPFYGSKYPVVKQSIYQVLPQDPYTIAYLYNANCDNPDLSRTYSMPFLIATYDTLIDQPIQAYRDSFLNFEQSIFCDLTSPTDYIKALRYLQSLQGHGFGMITNFFIDSLELRSLFAALNVFAAIMTILLTLISLINLVNIISTGIMNRKKEFASLQCIGMDLKQLYKMVAFENVHYVLFSAICSSLLVVILNFLTIRMISDFNLYEDLILYTVPYPAFVASVWIWAIVAFMIALLISILSLQQIKNTSLIEQIREVELS